MGSSGLFGEEAPGDWLTADEAVRRYRRIFRGYRYFGDDGFLVRARLPRLLFLRLLRISVGWYDTLAAL
jgi:hypothetical protein